MHWIEAYRRRMCMEARELAELAGVTESLIYILENQAKAVTHPLLANRIAEVCGASAEQRDMIVAAKHRGTWKPGPKRTWARPRPQPKPEPEPPPPPREIPKGTGQRGGLNKRAVVKLDRFGRVLARYEGVLYAARLEQISPSVVFRRCGREINSDEFRPHGCTWRYADEWDAMSPGQRAADLAGRYGK